MRRSGAGTAALLFLLSAEIAGAVPALKPEETKLQKPAEAQSKPGSVVRTTKLAGEEVFFVTSDGWTLSARYQPPANDNEPVFILLHEARGRRSNWYSLGRKFAQEGIGYLAVDLRGHGESTQAAEGAQKDWRKFRSQKNDNDFDDMREDVAAAVAFLKTRGIEGKRVHIGGAEVGGSIAIKYAALHADIGSVFMLSPGFSHKEVLSVNAVRAYTARPILMIVGDDDRRSAVETPILFEFARRSAGIENASLLRVPKSSGTRMFYYNKDLASRIVAWVRNPYHVEPDVTASSEAAPGAEPADEDAAYYDRTDGLPSDEELERSE